MRWKMKFTFYATVLLTKMQDNAFFELIIDKAPSFKTLHDSARFIWLLTCEEEVIINALADFVFQCFELRNLTKTQ